MAKDGLVVALCAYSLLIAGGAAVADDPAADKKENAVAANLAVQAAFQQGREHLLHGEYRLAVNALESQLMSINGSQAYLRLLQDAYRRYIQELRLAKQDGEAERYLKRLLILDRGALLDRTLGSMNVASLTKRKPAETKAPPTLAKPVATFRLQSEDEPGASQAVQEAMSLMAQAEKNFEKRHFREAGSLYERASKADEQVVRPSLERWAYCKLFAVVEEINRAGSAKVSWPNLEEQVRVALQMAPRLEYGKQLLEEIQKRKDTDNRAYKETTPVRDTDRQTEGWSVAESDNFRILHHESADLVKKVARQAERARATMLQKWFGGAGDVWNPKCDIYLHATARDYGQATGQFSSPGHSTIKMENGRLVIRRIDLHCDEPTMLTAVLPHETTHVVLAGQFGEQLLPRWADEGIAVLTEPREKIERHHDNLTRCAQDGQLFHLRQLLQMSDYPQNPRGVSAFYAESVALVEYLVNQQGPQAFALFLHESMRYGYDKALSRQYGIKSVEDLERRWNDEVLREHSKVAEVNLPGR